eukprot:19473-Heterococcus_DN1.PRE.1
MATEGNAVSISSTGCQYSGLEYTKTWMKTGKRCMAVCARAPGHIRRCPGGNDPNTAALTTHCAVGNLCSAKCLNRGNVQCNLQSTAHHAVLLVPWLLYISERNSATGEIGSYETDCMMSLTAEITLVQRQKQ